MMQDNLVDVSQMCGPHPTVVFIKELSLEEISKKY
jgi:hypothetical protein